jgi:NTP pyrophosphatase (non-canonical NTP hydrolase)
MELKDEFGPIRVWAENRGLYEKGDTKTQYIKLQEECGELAKALLKDDREEIIDAIGDIVIVLTNLTQLTGFAVEDNVFGLRRLQIEDCVNKAYQVIAKRTGKMENGTFVKDAK